MKTIPKIRNFSQWPGKNVADTNKLKGKASESADFKDNWTPDEYRTKGSLKGTSTGGEKNFST